MMGILAIEPFAKVFAVAEIGDDGRKYGIYHCGSRESCEDWIRETEKRERDRRRNREDETSVGKA
jgi:hypothetical protein